jgi:uncharacterized delta-60 repeat protein
MKKILFFTGFFFAITATAQQGTLDSSFATNGIALNENIRPYSIGLQKNGKIIAAGYGGNEGVSGSTLACYNSNGSLDSSFGKNGYAVIGYDIANQAEFNDIFILDNDKIIACANGTNIFIAKFTADGKPDSSFGTAGYVQTNLGFNEAVVSLAVQADGKIVVAGSQTEGFFDPFYAIVLRYTPDGLLDTSFGDGGKVVLYESLGIASLAIQKDGKIIAGGSADAGDSEFFVARLNPDGSYDQNFGNHGYVFTRFSENRRDGIASVALQPDGKILAAGVCNIFGANQDMGIARYNTDGSLDYSFGEKGLKSIHVYNSSEAATVLLQKDGNIILSGRTFNDIVFKSDAVLVKLHSNGTIDSSFATEGIAITDLSNSGYDSEYGTVLQDDGKIIVAGQSDFRNSDADYGNIARFKNIDESRRQILIAKIRRWLQHHNGITWDNLPGTNSYAVQRSSNGVNWNTIFNSRRSANNQRSTANNYADPSPLPGTNYYRLQTTSVDGAVAYSNVIAIGDENSSISLSPNPAKNVLQITGLSSSEKTKIMVVDLSGNMAISPKLITNSTSTYNLNIATLKSGNYMLRIESNGVVVTKQFVKE